jgi:peptidoglycan/LPS O-acetylase OafA/YrhL
MGLMNIWKDPSINIPAWSISAEFFAYLSFPVIWFMIGKAKGKIVLLSIIFSLIFVYVSGIAMVIGMHWHYGLGAVFRVLCGFSIGCVLYRLYSDKICVFYTPVHNDHVFITCVIGLFVVLFISLPVYFVYPFLPFIIFYLAVSQGYVKVFFSSRPMVYLGMISYSVYLVHYPVLEIYRILLNDYFAGLDMVSDQKEIRFWMTAIVVSVLIAAALIYHGIEEPCRRWIRKRFLA